MPAENVSTVTFEDEELEDLWRQLMRCYAAWKRAKADVDSCGCQNSRTREAYHVNQTEIALKWFSHENRGVTKC